MAYYFSPFRKEYKPAEWNGNQCAFCDPAIDRQGFRRPDGTLMGNEHYRWIANYFPKFDGLTMLVPRRHLLTLADETPAEVQARHEILCQATDVLLRVFPGAGIETFLQTGPGSESSIKHLHWHLFPSLPSDPLRGLEKMGHFTTTEEGKEKVILFPIKIEKAREVLQRIVEEVLSGSSVYIDT